MTQHNVAVTDTNQVSIYPTMLDWDSLHENLDCYIHLDAAAEEAYADDNTPHERYRQFNQSRREYYGHVTHLLTSELTPTEARALATDLTVAANRAENNQEQEGA